VSIPGPFLLEQIINIPTRAEHPDRRHELLELRCLGPAPVVDLMVSKVCPHSAILNYDTTQVKVRRKANQTYLPKRCFSCQAEHTFLVGVKRYGLLAEEGDEHCSHNGCVKPLFHGTKFCEAHFYAWQPTVGLEGSEEFVELERRLKCAIAVKWKASPEMEKVLRLFDSIRAGDTLPSKLMFLDLEFNTKTKRVYEVGMCDANGVITMDCLTKYSPDVQKSLSANPDRQNAYIDQLIQNSVRNHNCRHGRMTARQIADELEEQGVTEDTLVVTWHLHAADLSALREWLEAEGHPGIMPQDAKCIPVIRHFRPNLALAMSKDGKPFSLSLPIIFPVLMGTRHYLSGRNHHAAVDAQQLRYMVEAFGELCKKPKDRPDDWLLKLRQAPDSSGVYQPGLESFWGKDNGSSSRNS
jgi:hypothetical protein